MAAPSTPSRKPSCFAILAGCLALFGRAALADHPSTLFGTGGGPINTFSATTLPKGSVAGAFRFEYVNSDRFSDAEILSFAVNDIDADSIDFTAGAFVTGAYGLTDNITLAIRLPYYFQDDIREPAIEDGLPLVENEGSAAGHGDILGLAVVRLVNFEERKIQLSLIGGLEVPSGFTRVFNSEGVLFEAEHQPGSGSWDPVAGVAITKDWEKLSFHANVMNLFATRGTQDTNQGDIFNYNAALVWRALEWRKHSAAGYCRPCGAAHDLEHEDHLHPHSDGATETDHQHDDEYEELHHHDDHHHEHVRSLDLILELNGFWEEKTQIGDEFDPNTGGNLIYVAPGVRFSADHWYTFLAFGIPIHQRVYGFNHRSDFQLVWGTGLGF